MSLWRHLMHGLKALLRRDAANREIDAEVESYLEESTASWIDRGLTPADACRAARLEMGSTAAVREQVRDSGWENAIGSFFDDLRRSLRRLFRTPSFTATAVLTIALAIGATAAIFSAVSGVLLKPLQYPGAERLVALQHTAPGIGIKELNMAPSLYFTYNDESRVFEHASLWTEDSWTLTGVAEPEQVRGLSVSHEFLQTLGMPVQLGREFTSADEIPTGERVVILSDAFWRTRFGADRSTIGRQLRLDGNGYTVVGILPPAFRFLDRPIELIAPVRMNRADVHLIQFCCKGIARMNPGVSLAAANADVARMLPMAAAKFPPNPGLSRTMFEDARIAPRLTPLKDFLVGNVRGTLWVLLGTVAILLGIACANVANLMLVRTEARRQELATRVALGAGGWRIARELMLESVLLSCAGGFLGLGIAAAALRCFTASAILHLPRMDEISIDPIVLVFVVILSVFTGVLFGLVPAYRFTRPELTPDLGSGGRSSTGSRTRLRTRSILVSAQMALALVLVVGSGLMIRSAIALHRVAPGFSAPAEVQSVRIAIPSTEIKDGEAVTRAQQEILRKLETIPGVSSAAIANMGPMDGGSNDPVYAEDWTPQGGTPPIRRFKFISPGYVSAIGSHLAAGREFTWADLYNRAPVVLISENFARELWHNPQVAIGKHVRSGPKSEWREVIGVIADLHDDGMSLPAPAILYWPLLLRMGTSDSGTRNAAFLIRSPRAGSTALNQEIRQAIRAVNATLPLIDVKTLQSVYDQSVARTSFTLLLLSVAGAMALILGVVGIYGTISYSVAQRRREVGIRLALGSPGREITGMFVRQGLTKAAMGLVFGLAAALALAHVMKSVLFQVQPADPGAYIAASATLVAAALLASYFPARRATRIDPVEALRTE